MNAQMNSLRIRLAAFLLPAIAASPAMAGLGRHAVPATGPIVNACGSRGPNNIEHSAK